MPASTADLTILHTLTRAGVDYCVLHGWPRAPGRTSDLDLAIAPEELVRAEVSLREDGAIPVQQLQHEATCFYLVYAQRGPGGVELTTVDVSTDYRRDGRIYFTSTELLAGRRQDGGVWRAHPRVEFRYLLVKKVSKLTVPTHQRDRLRELHTLLGPAARADLIQLFGGRWGARLDRWLDAADWQAIASHLGPLRRALRWQALRQGPARALLYWAGEIRRRWARWRRPTGLMVAVLGPDGAGKTMVIRHLAESLGGAFRRTAAFHLRPRVLPPRAGHEGPVTRPHAAAPHHLLVSAAKALYYLADYLLGYWLVVRPALVRSSLVLFDRYFDDLLIDPRRYRSAAPSWFIRWCRRVVPRPGVILVLDAPASHLMGRKQEVSMSELLRQRDAYRDLALTVPAAHLLDATRTESEVAQDARDVLLEALHLRYHRRRSGWLGNDIQPTLDLVAPFLARNGEARLVAGRGRLRRFAREWRPVAAYAYLPLTEGRACLLPAAPAAAAARGLAVYNPQRRHAQLAHRVLAGGLRLGLVQRALPPVQFMVRKDGRPEELPHGLLPEHLRTVMGRRDLTLAISLGTPGPHRKPVIQVMAGDGQLLGYAKIGRDPATIQLVRNEARTLQQMGQADFTTLCIPRVIHAGWWDDRYVCILSGSPGSSEAPARLTPLHLAALSEMRRAGTRRQALGASSVWAALRRRVMMPQDHHSHHTLTRGVARVEAALGDTPLPFHPCHGDFAPWNVRLLDDRLYAFDWEYAADDQLPGWDVFHFVFQTAHRLERRSPSRLSAALEGNRLFSPACDAYFREVSLHREHVAALFLGYLLDRATSPLWVNPGRPESERHVARTLVRLLCEG